VTFHTAKDGALGTFGRLAAGKVEVDDVVLGGQSGKVGWRTGTRHTSILLELLQDLD
jgi:hypothetical protein